MPYKALVVGAKGAIGQAFVDAFEKDANCTHVEIVSRSVSGFDLRDETSIRQHASICSVSGPYNVIIDATGEQRLAF